MNINKYRTMEPMKYLGAAPAKRKVEEYLSNPASYKGWSAAQKVDGEYGRIIYDGNTVIIQGRGISKKTGEYVEKSEHLPHIAAEVQACFPPNTVVIGEFAFDKLNTSSKDVATIFRCLPDKAIVRQADKKIKFYIFDVLAMGDEELDMEPYWRRRNHADTLSKYLKDSNYIEVIPAMPAEEALSTLDEILALGGEGMVIMNNNERYYPGGRRGTVSIKIKKEMGEMTLPVINFVDPNREYEGKDASTWEYYEGDQPVTKYYSLGWKQGVVVDYNGRPVKITSGISDEDGKWLASKEAQLLLEEGRLKAEVTAMETVQGSNQELPSLRHPVILRLRTDL